MRIKFKRLTAFLLSAAMALSLMTGIPFSELGLGITASAEESTIIPVTPQLDSDGFYSIGSAAELYGFAELVNNGNTSANAKLTADIIVNENVLDANGDANTGDFVQWISIGNYEQNKTYSGTFDGQGHTVSGLYVSGSDACVGFIGEVSGSAVVKNLGIVDSYFSSSHGYLGSIVGNVSDNSSVTLANVYSTSTVKGDNWIGGLAGGDGSGSVTIINSYFAGKTSANWAYGTHHDDLVAGNFSISISGTLNVVNAFVLGTSQYGTSVTAEQLSDGTVAAPLHYYQDALADGSMFGISDGKTAFSGSLEGVSVTTADITLHTFDGNATAYSSNYVVGNTTPLPVNVVRSGYKFAGWYDNADLEGDAVTSISSSETGNKEYWAKFERSHSVTFVLNDGYIQTGEIDHYIEGKTTALPTMVFKNSASFEGWYTTEDFTGSRYYSIPSTATEDMVFYAKWGEEKTRFYLVQGGSGEPVNVLYEGENVVYLDKTTMNGYYVSDEDRDYWGGFSESVNVPYTGGESTFDNGGRAFNVAQSGFYVFTLTDKGEGKWFVSVLYLLENYITAVADIPDQTYTGSAIEPEIGITTTLTLDTDYTITFSDNTNAGTAKATITGKGNYGGTIVKTFTINKAAVTVTADNASKTYGEDDPAFTYTATGLEVNDTLTGTLSRETGENAGTYAITQGTLANPNYDITFVDGTFTINKATPPALTIPTATSITYGEKLSASTLSDSSWAWVDGTIVPNANANYNAYIEVDDSNYDYTGVYGYDDVNHRVVKGVDVIITRATLTITANSYTIKVGDTLPTYAYDVTGLVNNDTFPFDVSLSCSAADSNTVGIYPITISGVATDALASLYVPIYVNGELTITEKDIQEIAADDVTLTYGETGKKIAATTSGDGAISYSTTSDVISVAADGTIIALKAGTATVTVKAAETDNYAEATTTISVTVNKATPTAEMFTYTEPANLTYDGTAKSASVVANQDITGMGEITVKYYQNDTLTDPVGCGTYSVKISVADSDNNIGVTDLTSDNWMFTINHADSDNNGYCDGCGAIYDGIGAHLAGYSVSLNGSIGVNFHMDLTQDVLEDNEAYMLFTLPNGTTQKVMVSDARAKEPALIEEKTYYIFTCNVAAKEMTDTIQAQLITSDGSKTQVYEYSVREYAETILSGIYDDETKELVRAMLHYGAYSQEWFDYNTTNLANEGLDPLNLSEADNWDEFNPIITNDEKVGSFTSAYLTLESDTAINLKFKLADGVSFEDLRFVVQDSIGNVVPATTVTTGNVCLITLTGIKASDLDTTYDFSVTDKEGNKSAILYSAMSYARAVANSEMDQKLKNVTAALRIFNIRANEKFEN